VFLFGVKPCGVGELSIVVLGIECSFGGLSNLDEVGDVLKVGEVLVEVVLGMLEEVHVLLDEVISSNSGEGESTVIKFPGVYE